jgi:hypothetical protein
VFAKANSLSSCLRHVVPLVSFFNEGVRYILTLNKANLFFTNFVLLISSTGGGYSILTDYVRNWRNGLIPGSGKSAFVPLKFQLGEAFQFDWSEESLMIGGIHRKIQVAHTKLCASRALYLSAYPTQTQKMLYDAHARAFTALGGVTKRGIYDNMKTAVDKAAKRNGRVTVVRYQTCLPG